MLSNYIETGDVAEYGYQLDETDEPVIGKIIPRAARLFDLFAEVKPGFFGKAADAASPQLFYGDGSAYLRVPRYVGPLAAGAVTMPDGYTVPEFQERTDRWENPYLQAIPSATSISLVDEAAWFYGTPRTSAWPEGVRVTVSARWGFAEVPDDVREAVLELVVSIWRGKDPAFAKVIRLDDREIISQAMPDRTKLVAASYAKRFGPEVGI